MNKYVLLQAPSKNEYDRGQIVILDNSNALGKHKAERYANDGYTFVGYIENELPPSTLRAGFVAEIQKAKEKKDDFLRDILKIAREARGE